MNVGLRQHSRKVSVAMAAHRNKGMVFGVTPTTITAPTTTTLIISLQLRPSTFLPS